jgi:hypothetical protein
MFGNWFLISLQQTKTGSPQNIDFQNIEFYNIEFYNIDYLKHQLKLVHNIDCLKHRLSKTPTKQIVI